MEHQFTVAVDLDGTITNNADDLVDAEPREGCREALQTLKDAGCRIIIFTVRGNESEINDWLTKYAIPFDFINKNPDQPIDGSNKIIADVYVDDRAINANQPWPKIVNSILAVETIARSIIQI